MGKGPNIFDKIDFIIKFFMDPCDAPWTAYAQAVGGAALELFVNLYSLDPSDIFWNAVGSAFGLGRARSGRKGRKGSKRRRGFDPNENLGHYIGQWLHITDGKYPAGIGFLWASFGLLQRLNFWFFFVGALIQFFFRWTSLLYNSKYCQRQRDAVLMRTNTRYVLPALFPWTDILVPHIAKQRGPISSVGGVVNFPSGYTGILTGSCSWTPRQGRKNQKVTMRVVQMGSGKIVAENAQATTDGTGGTFGVDADISDGKTYAVLIKVDKGFALIENALLYAQASPAR